MLISPYAYLAVLIFSLAGLSWLDFRQRIALFRTPKTTLKIIAIIVGFFLIWDIAGIILGIFATNPDFVVGINIATPNLPIEEVLLLALISYLTILLSCHFEVNRS